MSINEIVFTQICTFYLYKNVFSKSYSLKLTLWLKCCYQKYLVSCDESQKFLENQIGFEDGSKRWLWGFERRLVWHWGYVNFPNLINYIFWLLLYTVFRSFKSFKEELFCLSVLDPINKIYQTGVFFNLWSNPSVWSP